MRSTPLVALAAAAATALAIVPTPSLAAEVVPTGVTVAGISAKATGTPVRFATFNVRTSRADIGTSRHWLHRALSVAREIKAHKPGIVAIQELGPGRADGKRVSVGNGLRQTQSLVNALHSIGAGQYKLTRTTAYVPPKEYHGTQGPRILYDTSKYTLVSKCLETTGKSKWNRSCSMTMPMVNGAPTSAAYAEFKDRSTGRNFFVISTHLDSRHGSTAKKEKPFDSLRAAEVRAVYKKVNGLAGGKPILFGGDINSWKTKIGTHAPFNYLYSKGFRDSTQAPSRINAKYPTVNHFRTTVKANRPGRQVALDVVMAKGAKSFSTYENVMKVVDSTRPSDHNMVVSNLVL
jgi:endonuclease/exonuclease/phosphatase family metal-dependent hydrolase